MLKRGRRIRLIIAFSAVLALIGLLVAAALDGRPERIDRFWAQAVLNDAQSAEITEQIDWDFAHSSRHGIFRDVPDLTDRNSISVSSPDAPDDLDLDSELGSMKIGSPSKTVTGQHRYVIGYQLSSLVSGEQLSWNVHGLDWDVEATEVVGIVTAPYELTNVRCNTGPAGSVYPCAVEKLAPGQYRVRADDLRSHEAVTVYADRGAALADTAITPDATD